MLNTLSPANGSRSKRTRVGRGNAAGRGTTCGKGTKGQQSRAGKNKKFGFEGGQTPLLRRQPKLGGFRNPNRKEYEVVNVGTLEDSLSAGTYTVTDLKNAHLVRTNKRVKILGEGDLKKKFNLEVHGASKSAREAIEKAGGSVTVVK